MKHKGTLIEVRECLAQCIDNLHSTKEYNTDRYYEALQKLDALIAAVPDGVEQHIYDFEMECGHEPSIDQIAVIKAATILSEAVEVGE